MVRAGQISSRTFVRAAALAAGGIALFTLLGWAAGIAAVVHPAWVAPMAPLTACAVLACAVGVWGLADGRVAGLARAAGAIAALAGLAGTADSLLASGTEVNRLLFGANVRMPPLTGLAVVVLGIAIALDERARRGVHWAALAAGLVGAGALAGFLLGVPLFVGTSRAVQMSWQAAVCVSLIGIGLAAADPERGAVRLLGDHGVAGRFARGGLVSAVAIPVGAGTLTTAAARAGWISYAVGAWTLTLAAAAGLTVVTAVAAQRLQREDRARSEHERQLTELAIRDPLTGAYNRRHFATEAERAIARAHRYGERAAVAVLDLDHFKAVNDSWGHAAGDEALVRVHRALRARLRSSDVLGRIGGGEVAAIFRRVDEEGAACVAGELRAAVAAVRDELAAEGRESRLGASVGIATLDGPEDIEAQIDLADQRMYADKRGSREQVESGADH